MTLLSLLSSLMDGGGSNDNDSWTDTPRNPLTGMVPVLPRGKFRGAADASSNFFVCHFANCYCCAARAVGIFDVCHFKDEMVAVLYGSGEIAGYVSETGVWGLC